MSNPTVRLCCLALVLVLTGCRTYGDYGSGEIHLVQLHELNEAFESELERSRLDAAQLQAAAQRNPRLADLAREYAAAVAAHELVLAENVALAAELEEDGAGYRRVSRALGAAAAEREAVTDMYTSLRLDVRRLAGELVVEDDIPYESRYFVAPPFYERIRYGNQTKTMDAALQGVGRDDGETVPRDDAFRQPGIEEATPDQGEGQITREDAPADSL